MRPTEAVIDLDAIAANVRALAELAAPAQLCAVVKADGYGHGIVATARTALDNGASRVAVALVEEAVILRNSGIRSPILVLSEPQPTEMIEVVEFGITPTVYTQAGIAAIVSASGLSGSGAPIGVHLKVDTGMNRVGLRLDGAGDSQNTPLRAIQAIISKPEVSLEGLWTHFAVADEQDRPETTAQLERFNKVVDDARIQVASGAGQELLVHASNSAGLLGHPDAHFDMVRAGIALYGIAPAPWLNSVVPLRPAMSIRSRLGLVKRVKRGESVSYGLRHTFTTDTVVGTIPIGYADGLRRDAGLLGVSVLVGEKPCPIVGVVTMDQTIVDLGPTSAAKPGDEVVIVGSQGSASQSASEIAQRLQTIPYEVACGFSSRVRRRYI